MVQIKNNDTIKEIIKGANIQINEQPPTELARSVVPTMEVNPSMMRRSNFFKSAVASNAVSSTIFTTETARDFYITNIDVNVMKDVTATSTYSGIEITPAETGVAIECFQLATLTLTVQNIGHSFNLHYPLKLKRGTTVKVINATNTGNIRSYATICGYYVDDKGASGV
jgi:hypothetical protein